MASAAVRRSGPVPVSVGGRAALPPARVGRVVRAVLGAERRGGRVGSMQVTFVTRPAMARLHQEWKGKSGPTDVLSFALPAPDGTIAGDVYICPAVARAQAREFGVPAAEELLRLVIHGTLHVLGYDHPEGPGRTRSAMWRRQEGHLTRFG